MDKDFIILVYRENDPTNSCGLQKLVTAFEACYQMTWVSTYLSL